MNRWIFVVTLAILALAVGPGVEARRPSKRKRYDIFWYGPVVEPTQCLAIHRSTETVLNRKMFNDPSDMCTERNERICVCLRKVNKFKRRGELFQDLEHDFHFSCSTCHYTSNFNNKNYFITFD
eukprot:maker-scaffold534_size144770-snap-gene-0.30 protein:Tk11136 transcript:maker-scaffold534_size144770-snap-gene-0.30-mRNA-1 annotation:"nadh dehydrogenase"